MRMDEIQVINTGHQDEDGEASLKIAQPTYSETFCNPVIRKAAWIGCTLSVIQQLTGINAIMFYSGTIFTSSGMGANQATALIQTVNFGAVVVAAGLLGKFGRRTLMLYATAACTLFIFLTGIFANNQIFFGELVTTLIYVAAFEFGPGPVVWMYMSEIMNDKGVSIGTFLNWLFTLIVGLTTSGLFNHFTA